MGIDNYSVVIMSNRASTASSPVGFIRTKILQADKPGGLTEPFVAVNVKEAMVIPGKVLFYCTLIFTDYSHL